jgi:hypothetical protein
VPSLSSNVLLKQRHAAVRGYGMRRSWRERGGAVPSARDQTKKREERKVRGAGDVSVDVVNWLSLSLAEGQTGDCYRPCSLYLWPPMACGPWTVAEMALLSMASARVPARHVQVPPQPASPAQPAA